MSRNLAIVVGDAIHVALATTRYTNADDDRRAEILGEAAIKAIRAFEAAKVRRERGA